MKNKLSILLAVACISSVAKAQNRAEKIKWTKEECGQILDRMFFADKALPYGDKTIEGSMKTGEKIVLGSVETLGWWIDNRRTDILNQIEDLRNEVDVAADEEDAVVDEVLLSVEKRIEGNSKRLIRAISYDASDEIIQRNYDQLIRVPYLLCRNGLRTSTSNCEEIHERMQKFARMIADQRKETELPRN